MFTLELLTPVGSITAHFSKEVDKKDGGKTVINFPFVFENEELAKEFLKEKVKGKIFGYKINQFTPYEE